MTKEELLTSAAILQQPSPEIAQSFERLGDRLALELNQRLVERVDIDKLVGPDNLEMMQNNSRNMIRFMGSLFYHYEPAILVDTALWVFKTYRAHGFQVTYWPAYLDTFMAVLRQNLPCSDFEAVCPFFHWLIVNIPSFTGLSEKMSADDLKAMPGHDSESRGIPG